MVNYGEIEVKLRINVVFSPRSIKYYSGSSKGTSIFRCLEKV